MKALVSLEPGGPETLVFRDLPVPELSPQDVLIGVKACGINYPDGLIIRDRYQIRPQRPFSPGSEIAGVVEEVGHEVKRFTAGQHVLARLGWGGMAEKVAVPQERCTPIDETMPFEEAAAFIFTYGTAYYALVNRGGLVPGETVLVLGASGGVGLAAVQVAKALGGVVVAAASSEERVALALANGADRGVVYSRSEHGRDTLRNLSGQLKEACGKKGADLVVDPIGGPYAEPALRAVAPNGRYLVVGFVAGIPSIPLNLPLLKSCSIVGVEWGSFVRGDPAAAEAQAAALLDLYRQRKVNPVVSERFKFEDAPAAIARLEQGTSTGKVVVTIP